MSAVIPFPVALARQARTEGRAMSNVTYLHVIARQRAERRAALLRIARPTLVERIAYFFRRVFQ